MTVATAPPVPALVNASEFVGLDGITHLYCGAEGPMLRRSAAAVAEYVEQKSRAAAGRARHVEVVEALRGHVCRLLSASNEDIALLSSATEGINAVYGLIDFSPGDNIVINDLEFPSIAVAALRRKAQGVDVRVVRHEQWEIPTGRLLSAVDDRTRLVAVSHVSYVNGLRHDIRAIGEALDPTRTVFLVDATQSLGVLPVPAQSADFLVCSSYKWLLGTHGLGILYWNRARRPEVTPRSIGRQSVTDAFSPHRFERYTLRPGAGRFETAFCSLPPVYALSQSLPCLLETGIDQIAEHGLELGSRLIRGLRALHLEVMTPEHAPRRGASVSFAHAAPERLGQMLAARGIHVWAGDGRVRASLHLFNSDQDVSRLLSALAELLPIVNR
jgi:selenocysteine lyase/cysteine desulfurase